MDTVKQRIEEIKSNGYDIDFTATFSHAFEIYKKIALNAGLIFLMLSVVSCIIGGMFFGAAIFSLTAFSEQLGNFETENLTLGTLVIYFFAIVISAAILAPLNAGLIKMSYNADVNQHHSISTAFDYYKAPYFSELVVAGVIISAASAACNLPFEYLGISFIGILLSYIIALFTVLTIPLIIFGNLKALEAIQSSILIVGKSPLLIAALLIVAALAACVGIIAFCIGILFTLPIIYAMYYSIYVHTVGVVDSNISDGLDNY